MSQVPGLAGDSVGPPRRPVQHVMPGEFRIGGELELFATLLGSCVAVCLRDRAAGVGGMNHFLLPETGVDRPGTPIDEGARYGVHAVELLVNAIIRAGGERRRLEAKVFGGAALLAGVTDVGARNVAFIRAHLVREGLALLAEDLGGRQARNVVYEPSSGRAWCRRRPFTTAGDLAAREQALMKRIAARPGGSDVELF